MLHSCLNRREEGGVASGGGERRTRRRSADEWDERPRQGLGRVVDVVGTEELCEDEAGVRVERLPQQRDATPVRRDQK